MSKRKSRFHGSQISYKAINLHIFMNFQTRFFKLCHLTAVRSHHLLKTGIIVAHTILVSLWLFLCLQNGVSISNMQYTNKIQIALKALQVKLLKQNDYSVDFPSNQTWKFFIYISNELILK